MTREEILNSIQLKKRFVKDCNLSIAVFDNPYFMERLEILDRYENCLEKFDIFCQELRRCRSEQEYFEFYNQIKDGIINDMVMNKTFLCFNMTQSSKESKYARKNLYSEDNNGKICISLDMKKANFSALHHWSSKIFDDCETWEEFVGQYTNCQHILNSKYIRQVVMGACNPKQQIKYERYLMTGLLEEILPEIQFLFNVYSLGEDEIILIPNSNDTPKAKNIQCWYEQLQDALANSELKDCIRVTIFKLEKITGTDGWVKHIYNLKGVESDVEFKCLNSEIYHQIIKHFTGQPISENDLVFYHNGKLAKFLKEIENPWK